MDESMVAEGLKKALAGAAIADPYSTVTGTPNLDRFEPSKPIAEPGELGKLLDGVEKATMDKRGMAQLFEALQTVAGIAKTFAVPILVLILPVLVGCSSTPPSIAQAHAMEGQAAALYRSDALRYLIAQEADLRLALDGQIDLIRDYELKLAAGPDGKVDLARVTDLLAGAKAKRAEIEGKLASARAKLEQSEANWRIAAEIHGRVQDYLSEPSPSLDDATKLIGDVAGLRNKGAAQPAEEVRP